MKATQATTPRNPGPETRPERLLCACKQITESEVRESIDILKTPSVEGVSYLTGAGTGCTACHCKIDRLIAGKSACGPFSLCDGCGCCMAICSCSPAEAEACTTARSCSRQESDLAS
ncbi:MAG: (2Fe-2S)-binding protein [Verrucomicrobiales bacterium]|nr:(2Fe-2S)-binding protein [Verrucomicrobiales bacterium]